MSGQRDGLSEAIHAALFRPEHGCDGTEKGCRDTCPVPAYEVLMPNGMVDFLADELAPYVARREAAAAAEAVEKALGPVSELADKWDRPTMVGIAPRLRAVIARGREEAGR